jgi:hypothetical protein
MRFPTLSFWLKMSARSVASMGTVVWPRYESVNVPLCSRVHQGVSPTECDRQMNGASYRGGAGDCLLFILLEPKERVRGRTCERIVPRGARSLGTVAAFKAVVAYAAVDHVAVPGAVVPERQTDSRVFAGRVEPHGPTFASTRAVAWTRHYYKTRSQPTLLLLHE